MRASDRRIHSKWMGDEGFTLVELLVVIAVLALLASLSVPMVGSNDASRMRVQANALLSQLRLLKGEAASTSERISLVAVKGGYRLSPSGRTINCSSGCEIEVVANDPLATGISDEIRFYNDGSSTGGLITIRIGAREQKVLIMAVDGDIRER